MKGAHRVIPKPLDGEAVEFGALVLHGTPPSLNNIFVNGKKGRFKSADYKAWQVRACLQLRKQNGWHVPGAVHIRLAFNGSETRADLDNILKPIIDILMASGRIEDDRNVRKIEAEFTTGIKGTLIEIRRAGLQQTPTAPYSAKKLRRQVAASVAAIGASGVCSSSDGAR